jgi:predicted nucleic acid-binding protein
MKDAEDCLKGLSPVFMSDNRTDKLFSYDNDFDLIDGLKRIEP